MISFTVSFVLTGRRFVPEGTAVTIPPYVTHRQAKHFGPEPERFYPERWIDPSLRAQVHDAAFIPFAAGPGNCIGKPLALMEMRFVVAMMVQQFDLEWAEEYKGGWMEGMKDYLVWTKERLPVKLSVRT